MAALYVGVPWYRRRRRQFRAHLELRQGLLEESQGEVLALKRAWEISHEEITLGCRIDVGSEGSFGEVRMRRCISRPGADISTTQLSSVC